MEDKKKIILIIAFILIIIVSIIIAIFSMMGDNEKDKSNNTDVNGSNSTSTNVIEDEGIEEAKKAIEDAEKEEKKLKEVSSIYKYFLMEQCITKFYNATTAEDALKLIDKEAKEKLNINKDNVSLIYNRINNPDFCIDKIYRQRIDIQKNIYVVYLRLRKNNAENGIENKVLFVKIDDKNIDFSIYPNEYLSKFNYLNLKTDDIIKIDNNDEIEKNDKNQYEAHLILEDKQALIKELFERYKFDVNYDISNLYNNLDKEYKEERFKNTEDLKKYINENKQNILNDEISKYKVTEKNNYVIICKNNTYVFNVKDIMNYTLTLDSYVSLKGETKKEYDVAPNSTKSRYCITRIIKAINNKDYDYVYSKLNIAQKNNYYPNIEKFKEFLQKIFYEENNYEINKNYLKISKDIYQYEVTISNANGGITGARKLVMTVDIKDEENFAITINTK